MDRIIIFLLTVFPVCLQAQDENWVAYMAQYEKGPGSTLVNLSAKPSAPVKGLIFLLSTGVTFKDCNPEGLPDANEFSKLYSVSDSVKSVIDHKIKSNMLAGTFTYQCRRLDYYYLSDTSGIRSELEQLYKKQFPDYSAFINIKPDSSWNTYLNFLYPSQEIFEYLQDEKVVMRLKQAGDNPDKERQIDHWLYFATDADRKCIFPYLSQNNFLIESMDKSDNKDYPYSLHISRKDKAAIGFISKLTKELRAQAKKCKGVYDGWESPVVK